MLLLINSQHVSARIGHQQVILEEYTTLDEIHINYNASIKCIGYMYFVTSCVFLKNHLTMTYLGRNVL
jgi:hypothetical protein